MEKVCRICKISKSIDEFIVDKKLKAGSYSFCKSCKKEYDRLYYIKNREKILERCSIYNHTHKDVHKEYIKKYSKRPSFKKAIKEYYLQKRDKINNLSIEEREKHREMVSKKRAEKKKLLKKTPRDRITRSLNNRLHHYPKFGKIGKTRLEYLLQTTISNFVVYLESKFLPTMTWENHGKLWHIDHIVPCMKFDLTKEEEQLKCFNYTNLQPLFAKTTVIDGVEYIGNLNKNRQ